ncbi:alpha-1-acid glycoprotein 1 isoform X3 [Arvicola amphibius]|uniref:alpha-1-acid glycoprotein 1 isoform X3 n=1 Tax=Arvicola amphibius TaxID=1047088 RepID=UPI0018E336CE|nr:alpha-1-acid glycoprotein 1 isoform X3 [Arvicola amphibius]
MVLHMVLVILSLLPLLEAQNPEHANITGTAITNDTLIWLSGKWFYIGSALRNLEFKQAVQKIQAEYFYFTPNLTDNTILLQEYQTSEDRCVFNSTKLGVQRENGTLSKFANKTDIAPELLEEFLEAVRSLGMDESEIIYTDWKKDVCSQQQKQREPERKKTEEGP